MIRMPLSKVAVGLISNPTAIQRWMIAGPEVARIVQELKALAFFPDDSNCKHHEQVPSQQLSFRNHLQSTVTNFKILEIHLWMKVMN